MTARRSILAACAALLVGAGLAACGSSQNPSTTSSGASSGGSRARIVVTYPVLGAVVKQVVGSSADVTVLMPNGADPHEWSPSARDVATLGQADLVIANGLGLEGGLVKPLEEAKGRGVDVFSATDHITVRTVKAGEGAEPDDPDQAPGAQDPHLWTDPLTMKQWVTALGPVLRRHGVDASAGIAATEKDLDAVHAEVQKILGAVPAERRKLVTGHESLGYFAQRYGFTLVGAVVPSLSSQGEPSAAELAALTTKIKSAGVTTVFTEQGTPAATAQAIGRDAGAKVVELGTHALPADGSYRTFLTTLATAVAGGLR